MACRLDRDCCWRLTGIGFRIAKVLLINNMFGIFQAVQSGLGIARYDFVVPGRAVDRVLPELRGPR